MVAKRVPASMRQSMLFAAACLCSYPAIAQTQNQPVRQQDRRPIRPPWPLQVEMRVPFEPTAFPSGPHVYLMYELHLTNFMPMPVSLSRIEVIDADARTVPTDCDLRSGATGNHVAALRRQGAF